MKRWNADLTTKISLAFRSNRSDCRWLLDTSSSCFFRSLKSLINKCIERRRVHWGIGKETIIEICLKPVQSIKRVQFRNGVHRAVQQHCCECHVIHVHGILCFVLFCVCVSRCDLLRMRANVEAELTTKQNGINQSRNNFVKKTSTNGKPVRVLF